MSKSSYTKLKEENKLLKSQLFTIAKNPESLESKMIIAGYALISSMQEAILYGSRTLKESHTQQDETQEPYGNK